MTGVPKIWIKGAGVTNITHNYTIIIVCYQTGKHSSQADIFEIARDGGGSNTSRLLKNWINRLKHSGSNRHHTRSTHNNHVLSNRKTSRRVDIFEIVRE